MNDLVESLPFWTWRADGLVHATSILPELVAVLAGLALLGSVDAAVSWDPDGPGPLGARLVAATSYRSQALVEVGEICAFDPVANSWTELGQGMNGSCPGASANGRDSGSPVVVAFGDPILGQRASRRGDDGEESADGEADATDHGIEAAVGESSPVGEVDERSGSTVVRVVRGVGDRSGDERSR